MRSDIAFLWIGAFEPSKELQAAGRRPSIPEGLSINWGSFFESAEAQELAAHGLDLFYYGKAKARSRWARPISLCNLGGAPHQDQVGCALQEASCRGQSHGDGGVGASRGRGALRRQRGTGGWHALSFAVCALGLECGGQAPRSFIAEP